MIAISIRVVVLSGVLLLAACAGISRHPESSERLDERGVSAAALTAEARSRLNFVNADARPHEIYSNDCPELSSTLLKPGATYTTELGAGPKVCHFQDLLAPSASSYYGTIEVQEDLRQRR